MKSKRIVLLLHALLTALILTTAGASAEIIFSPASLQPGSKGHSYFSSLEVHRILAKLSHDHDPIIGIKCTKGKYQVQIKNLIFFQAANLPSNSIHPQSGLWMYRYLVTRCGPNKIYDASAEAKPNNPPQYKITVPGETAANIKLQSDIMLHIL